MSLLNKLAANTNVAKTWNGADSYSTTGLDRLGVCLDYFAKCGTYVNRSQEAVDQDMARIFSDDEHTALSLVFALRLISRKPNVDDIDDVQTGYGRRDEFYKAIVWLHNNRPDLLYKNLSLIPIFGSWKDFVQVPLVNVLNSEEVYNLFRDNLDDNLLRKYLPQIRSKGKLRTDRDKARVQWAKGLCSYLGIDSREYRKLKSQGAAHIWQRQMGRSQWDDINFNGVPGKAMLRHTTQSGKDGQTVFERHGQVERLREWVTKQKSVKFTGYPYELTRVVSRYGLTKTNLVQKLVVDKQFETVLQPMRNHNLGNVLPCLDISGSMTCQVAPNVMAYDVCLSMGIAFSMMNNGYFKDVVCGFSDKPVLAKLGGSMSDRMKFIEGDYNFQSAAMGSTNFQGVIDLLVKTRRQNPSIPLSEYPETLLVISDMQFNIAGGIRNDRHPSPPHLVKTNYEVAVNKLRDAGLGNMRIVWWVVNGNTSDFPAQMDDKGCYMISGFDPVNLKALVGADTSTILKKEGTVVNQKVEKESATPLDGMLNVLNQPIFSLLVR